ncbi:MAG: MFS transporter [Chloroflexota bacterium]|nr:MFS transporter [Chloroflexota bacterium]
MTTTRPTPASTRRERWAWYLYDFGNSAYAAVVLLAVYSAYFKGSVIGGAEGSRLWGIAVGIAMLVVAVTSPVLGTLADFSGGKKRFLLFFTALTVIFCATLFFVQQGDWFIGMLFFILAEIGYRSAQVFYNALLPDIAHPDEIGRISGNGWAIGSFGGILCLLIVLVPIMLTGSDPLVVRLSLVFTALYFAVSSLPIMLWIRERAEPQELPAGESYLSVAFTRLADTFKTIRTFKEFVKFIIASLLYNNGILMMLNFAAILGAVLFGMEQQELIIFMIMVQLTSVAGAYLFGLLADEFGGNRSLMISLLLMIVPVVWLYFNHSRLGFYFIGGLAGFALTGAQSVSRTIVGMFSPPGKSAEFYGFFAVTGRTSSFFGPTIFGILAAEATEWYQTAHQMAPLPAEQAGHRLALFSIVAFLVAGTAMLLFVNERKGRALVSPPVESQSQTG